MPKQNADIFEVLFSQMGECRNINAVLGKAFRILGHSELFEPIRKLLHRRPRADLPAIVQKLSNLAHDVVAASRRVQDGAVAVALCAATSAIAE